MKALLIDDHALFRDALGMLIGVRFPALQLLDAGTLAEGLAHLSQHPDVQLVLLDLNLPDTQGTSAIAAVRDHAPAVQVVVLSADDRPETVERAIELGACGFVPKTARGDTLAHALQVTLDGGVYLPTATSPTPAACTTPASLGLSPRQSDVLRLLIHGHPNKLICRELELSESTVKTHLAAVFRRLDVSNRTQAVVAAARMGLRM